MLEKKRYDTVDLLKFIASIFIFILHTNILKKYDGLCFSWQLIARLAVPFFFIASAFFLYGKIERMGDAKGCLKAYCARLAVIYAGWFVFNLPSFALNIYSWKYGFWKTVWSIIKGYIIASTFTGSWFINACIVGAVLVYFIDKHCGKKALIVISAIIWILCCITSVYAKLTPKGTVLRACVKFMVKKLCFPTNLICGIPCFAVGKYIAEGKINIEKIKPKTAVCLFVLSFLGFCGEAAVIKYLGYYLNNIIGVLLFPATVFLFIAAIKSEKKIKNAAFLRKLSSLIYFSQADVLTLGYIVGKRVSDNLFVHLFIYCFLSLSVIVCFLLLEKKIKFLKKLV